MRIQGAGGGLAALLLVVSSTHTFATGVAPEASQKKPATAATTEGKVATATPNVPKVINPQAAEPQAQSQPTPKAEIPAQVVSAAPAASVQQTSAPVTKSTKTAAVRVKPAVAAPSLVATINLSTQRMSVSSNGRPLYTWRISSGRRGYETPRGSFRPGWMAKQWYSRKYNMSPMPYSVFFNSGIATHGTTAVSRLGRPASHGCIRLQTANARRFYNLVRKHGMKRTRIVVKGSTKHTRYAKRSTPRRISRRITRRRRSLGVVRRRASRYTARSYNRTLSYLPRSRYHRVRRPRRLVYPGDRY